MSNKELPPLPAAFGHVHDGNGNQPLWFDRGPVTWGRSIGCSTQSVYSADQMLDYARAALAAQPVAPKGWKQIGWTCDEGACGRIHDEPSTADPEFTQPVYVAVEASKPERKTLHVCTLECGDTYITSGSAEAEIGETPEVIESFDMPAFAVDLILKSLPEYDNG